MSLKVIGAVVVILASCAQGLPFGDFKFESVAEIGDSTSELKRDKRTLTTICVEIKPSSPYEEPYFMCKGTDSSNYPKGSSKSDSYSSKPSYKPSKPGSAYSSGENESYHSGGVKDKGYHSSLKPEYHGEHSKYDKPSAPSSSYDSGKEYSIPSKLIYDKHPSYDSHPAHHSDSYSNYEAPSKPSSYAPVKPTYEDHHHYNYDEKYSKTHTAHAVIFEKPSAPSYSSKPQSYNHENPSSDYDHRQPTNEYNTKPNGYSKPSSSSFETSEYSKPSSYDHSSDSYSSHNKESHAKPSYNGPESHSYTSPIETKVLYSKPSSHPAKQTTYDHSDHSHYEQASAKPAYSDQSSSNYQPSQAYKKPVSYTSPQVHNNYRMMPQDLMQPTWEPQPEQLQPDGFGYRSYGAPMEYQRQETPRIMNIESKLYNGADGGPLRFDLSGVDQEDPTLQSPYQQQTYSPPAPYRGAAVSSYTPSTSSYSPVPTPVYVPVQHQSYAPPPAPISYAPPPAPPCPQNYLYSYQPVIMSVPCYSLPTSYSLPSYAQSLGSPLQDHNSSARSENNPQPNNKSKEESEETHENDKKSDSQEDSSTSKKSESQKTTPAEVKEENSQIESNSKEQVVGGAVEKPIQETQITPSGSATQPKNPAEVPHTKEAFNAMMKMARIAAQLNKDDPSNKGATEAATAQSNERPPTAGPLPQLSRTTN